MINLNPFRWFSLFQQYRSQKMDVILMVIGVICMFFVLGVLYNLSLPG